MFIQRARLFATALLFAATAACLAQPQGSTPEGAACEVGSECRSSLSCQGGYCEYCADTSRSCEGSPCCFSDDACVDFGGGLVCATECSQDADCNSYCCVPVSGRSSSVCGDASD